jgi:hypothetical protein
MSKKTLCAENGYSRMEQKPFHKQANLKSHVNRGNFLIRRIFLLSFLSLIGYVCTINSVNAQAFGRRDLLNESTVRIPPEASNLTIGQRLEVSVFNNNGRNVSRGLRLSSDNEYVRISDMSFLVEYKADPWMHIDGSLIEINGNITVTATESNQLFTFPFRVSQAYTFDKGIICRGAKREFAVARYKNELGKELFAVMDITGNQLHLLEGPVSIDASGVRGTDGSRGAAGRNGASGTERSVNGGAGSPGSPGGNGSDGVNGGDITVYLPHNIEGISVNVNGGEGGRGGSGGSGGRGGTGYSRKTGETTNVLGIRVPRYEKIGRDGTNGSDGISGNDGRNGRNGTFNKVQVDDIQRYFLNVRQRNFNLDNIDLD